MSAAPGPWTMVQNSWQYTTIYDADGRTVCHLDLGAWGVHEGNQDELEARQAEVATQLTAAPEMLAALRSIAVGKMTASDAAYVARTTLESLTLPNTQGKA